ncbi:MAG: hypothetical protein HKK66_03370 [Chlorobiaceae bacterium]|nr:hypothetical protein [Chlorobiaceae bacterium]
MIEGLIEQVQSDALRDNSRIVYLKAFIAGSPVLVCPACGKTMHFIKTVNGKSMPCEIELKRGDFKMTLVTHGGVTVRRAGTEWVGYEPHFGYCEGWKRGVRYEQC